MSAVRGAALSNVAKISVGTYYSCALLESGQVKCWGKNIEGMLGNGTTTIQSIPVFVSNLTNATDIVASNLHTCASTEDALLKCWGQNASGQLGNGTKIRSLTPVAMVMGGNKTLPISGLENAKQVSAGRTHSCAVLEDKTIKCWGGNTEGQLGNGNTNLRGTYSVIVSNISTATQVGTGLKHTCALLEDKTVQCWGNDQFGVTGIPNRVNNTNTLQPTTVGSLSNVSKLFVGLGAHNCALLTDSKVKCWGLNTRGQLGNNPVPGSPDQNATPVYVHTSATDTTPLSGVVDLAVGEVHTCALLKDKSVKCWGGGTQGQLAIQPTNATQFVKTTPVSVSGLTGVKQIVAGKEHTCALLETGKVKCWGQQELGVLGNDKDARLIVVTPQDVRSKDGVIQNVKSIAAGFQHTCALLADGKVMCWGRGNTFQLGNLKNQNSRLAIEANILAGKVDSLALGYGYSLFMSGSLVTSTQL